MNVPPKCDSLLIGFWDTPAVDSGGPEWQTMLHAWVSLTQTRTRMHADIRERKSTQRDRRCIKTSHDCVTFSSSLTFFLHCLWIRKSHLHWEFSSDTLRLSVCDSLLYLYYRHWLTNCCCLEGIKSGDSFQSFFSPFANRKMLIYQFWQFIYMKMHPNYIKGHGPICSHLYLCIHLNLRCSVHYE